MIFSPNCSISKGSNLTSPAPCEARVILSLSTKELFSYVLSRYLQSSIKQCGFILFKYQISKDLRSSIASKKVTRMRVEPAAPEFVSWRCNHSASEAIWQRITRCVIIGIENYTRSVEWPEKRLDAWSGTEMVTGVLG